MPRSRPGPISSGFVFFPKSPRNVSLEQAAALAARARGRAKIVTLVVDADDALLTAIAAKVDPDLIQAHGAETPGAHRRDRAADGQAGDQGHPGEG